jgi:hypothetical protein
MHTIARVGLIHIIVYRVQSEGLIHMHTIARLGLIHMHTIARVGLIHIIVYRGFNTIHTPTRGMTPSASSSDMTYWMLRLRGVRKSGFNRCVSHRSLGFNRCVSHR